MYRSRWPRQRARRAALALRGCPMGSAPRSPAIEAFWQAFCRARAVSPDQRCDVFAFGDTAAHGGRAAGPGARRAKAGDRRVGAGLRAQRAIRCRSSGILQRSARTGAGEPGCIIRTTERRRFRPFDQVAAQFAWDEGEGDRTLATWRDGHRRCFTRQCAGWGMRVRRAYAGHARTLRAGLAGPAIDDLTVRLPPCGVRRNVRWITSTVGE